MTEETNANGMTIDSRDYIAFAILLQLDVVFVAYYFPAFHLQCIFLHSILHFVTLHTVHTVIMTKLVVINLVINLVHLSCVI